MGIYGIFLPGICFFAYELNAEISRASSEDQVALGRFLSEETLKESQGSVKNGLNHSSSDSKNKVNIDLVGGESTL